MVLLAMAGAVGCGMHTGVRHGLIISDAAPQVEMRPDERFLFPDPVSTRPMPAYPDSQLTRRAHEQVVCADLIIDTTGAVESVTPLLDVRGCPDSRDPPDPAFDQAVADAAGQWQFLAAAICRFPSGVPQTDDCSGEGVRIQPMRIRLSYRFVFSSQKGRGRAEASPAGGYSGLAR